MREKDRETEILRSVAHPIRKGIVSSLSFESKSFSNVMLDCGLDPGSETGIFLYHLSKLIGNGFVQKQRGKYKLSDTGKMTSKLLENLPHFTTLKNKEGDRKMIKGQKILPRIEANRSEEGRMSIDSWSFQPGEIRLYKESGCVSPDIFGRTFYVKECLGTVDLPNESKALMVRHETYKEKYRGKDANKLRTPIKWGYFLDFREYDTYAVRKDGVYLLWTKAWGPVHDTEKADETVYDPPERMNEPPMKIGDEKSDQKKVGKYLHSFHSKVIGQYEVTIDGRSFNCLLKQTHQTWTKEGELEIGRVSERYVTDGLVDVLTRAYHAPTQKRKWILESIEGWENNPTLECCGENHYLTNEFYLANRTF